jgi:hypothetical protein
MSSTVAQLYSTKTDYIVIMRKLHWTTSRMA